MKFLYELYYTSNLFYNICIMLQRKDYAVY